jgi:hypothetical protein
LLNVIAIWNGKIELLSFDAITFFPWKEISHIFTLEFCSSWINLVFLSSIRFVRMSQQVFWSNHTFTSTSYYPFQTFTPCSGVNLTNLLAQSLNAPVVILHRCSVSPTKIRPTLLVCTARYTVNFCALVGSA